MEVQMGLFGSDVETLERKLKAAERELAQVIEGRPALALEAEKGEPAGLAELDGKAAEIRQRIENLTDALAAGRWQAKIARERELVPLIEARKGAGAGLKKALSSLVTAIGQVRAANAALDKRARELKERASGPNLLQAVLIELAVAFDLDGLAGKIAELDARKASAGWTAEEFGNEITRLKDGLAGAFPQVRLGMLRIDAEEAALDTMLADFRKRAALQGPKKRLPRPGDHGTGAVGFVAIALRDGATRP